MDYFIKKLSDTEENDIIFINVQDKITKKRYFKKMYRIDDQLYKVNLEDNFEIIKFGTNESHNNFTLL